MSKQIGRELEVKFNSTKAKNLEVAVALGKTSFCLVSDGKETNTRFDTPSGHLEAVGATARLREDRTGYLLTVKERTTRKKPHKKPGRYKDQQEGNVKINNPEVIRRIMTLFGAQEESYFKLRQHWYQALRRVCIEVDFVPELGRYFVEIEAPTEKKIDQFRRLLRFSWDKVEPKSYFQLIREARAKRAQKEKKRS